MLKLNASYSKKVPAEQEYSSKSFMACIEVELPSGATAKELEDKIHQTFDLVKRSVEDEISGAVTKTAPAKTSHPESARPRTANRATNKQIQYILSLGKEQGLGLPKLNQKVADLYGEANLYNLSKHDASKLVDVLKQAA